MRTDLLRYKAEQARQQRSREHEIRRAREARQAEKEQASLNILVGQESWDLYLRKVTERQGQDQKSLEELEERQRSTQYMESPERDRIAWDIARLRERIAARDECLRLPKELLGRSSDPAQTA